MVRASYKHERKGCQHSTRMEQAKCEYSGNMLRAGASTVREWNEQGVSTVATG